MKPEPAFLAFISTWEAVALITGKIPTVTTVVKKLHRLIRVVIAAGIAVWGFLHFETHRR